MVIHGILHFASILGFSHLFLVFSQHFFEPYFDEKMLESYKWLRVPLIFVPTLQATTTLAPLLAGGPS